MHRDRNETRENTNKQFYELFQRIYLRRMGLVDNLGIGAA